VSTGVRPDGRAIKLMDRTAANKIDYASRTTGGRADGVPLVLLQHFRGNPDNRDPVHQPPSI